MHKVFHITQLQKYVHDPTHTIVHKSLEIDPNGLTDEEQLVKIVDHRVKQLRNKIIPLVKVLWTHHEITEATWETKEEMRNRFLYLFSRVCPLQVSRTKLYFKGGRM